VYSDHSEVNPFIANDDVRAGAGNNHIHGLPRPGPPGGPGAPAAEEVLVHPLQIAHRLQHELAPPPLPAITAYSDAACEAIGAVVASFAERSRLASEQADASEVAAQSAAMAHKVTLVVVAVRNLLYVSGTLTGPLPALANSHMGMGMGGMGGEDTDWVRSQIKPFQRKVTATLSKLVLSARAVNANPDWPATVATSTGRVESDAAELERAVTTFVFEIQRSAASQRAKRLHGRLLPDGVGPALLGAGAAAQWKGSGFVPLAPYPPQRKLGREAVSELSNLRLQAEDRIAALFTAVAHYRNVSLRRAPTPAAAVAAAAAAAAADHAFADVRAASDRVILAGRLAVAQLAEFLALAEDIDVAGYVDVEGGHPHTSDAYERDVHRARELVRTLETARQALYDDASVVLMASQAVHVSLFAQGDRMGRGGGGGGGPPDVVHAAIPALRENLGTSMETLESLLDIAQGQGEVLAARHHSSQLGHGGVGVGVDGDWVEVHQPQAHGDGNGEGEGGEMVELAEAIQAGGHGQPASREVWSTHQQQPQPHSHAHQAAYAPAPTSMAMEAEPRPSASASTLTAVDPTASTSALTAPGAAAGADEEELSDDEFDSKGRPKMGGNKRAFPFLPSVVFP
jgi:son of sevenless-like protein